MTKCSLAQPTLYSLRNVVNCQSVTYPDVYSTSVLASIVIHLCKIKTPYKKSMLWHYFGHFLINKPSKQISAP